MKDLNESVVDYFLKKNNENNENSKISKLEYIVSTSSVCGEGEHKIFEYIRSIIMLQI